MVTNFFLCVQLYLEDKSLILVGKQHEPLLSERARQIFENTAFSLLSNYWENTECMWWLLV